VAPLAEEWRPPYEDAAATRPPRGDHQRSEVRLVCGAKGKPPEAAPAV
jgi:hypothetical protein